MLYFLKSGDKIRIKNNLEFGKQYGNVILTQSMPWFLGDEDKIKYQITEGMFKGAYRLERTPFFWSEEMLEFIKEEY